MQRPWEVDQDAQFKRRLGKTALELGDTKVDPNENRVKAGLGRPPK